MPRLSLDERAEWLDLVTEALPALDRDELYRLIMVESGWDSSAVNPGPTHAVGLNQLLPSSLRRLGFSGDWSDFRDLHWTEQLPYVVKSFARSLRAVGPLTHPGDLYLMNFTPKYVHEPDDFIIFDVGSKGWQQNAGLRDGKEGPITAGSARAMGLPRGPAPPPRPPDAPATVAPASSSSGSGMLALLGLGAVMTLAYFGHKKASALSLFADG